MSEIKKPMLASDADLTKIKFPVIVQTKVDGCRMMHITGKATGRSLKPYKNEHTTKYYSRQRFSGFDGEAFAGEDMYAQNLCRKTTSALNRIKGEPTLSWMLFDLVDPVTESLPYEQRLAHLERECAQIGEKLVFVVPWKLCHNLEELLAFEQEELAKGAEGIILRDPNGMYKQGRSTVKEGGLLRIKRFVDEEAIVVAIKEGNKNNNVAKTNELGHTERSSHQENMDPNGQVGTLVCVKEIGGEEFNVAPGNMTEEDCIYYFQNQQEIVGKTITFKHFPKGRKEGSTAYRFPTFKHIRIEEDML